MADRAIYVILRSSEGGERRIGPFSSARAAAEYSYRIGTADFRDTKDWEVPDA
jgi:hypothetical protein